MKHCPFCVSSIDAKAKVCHVCHQALSLRGRVLKWMPFFSLLLAAPSVWLAVEQYTRAEAAVANRRVAERKRNTAVEQRDVARLESRAAKEAADVFSKAIPPRNKAQLRTDLKLNLGDLKTMEARLKFDPKDFATRKKLIMLKRLR